MRLVVAATVTLALTSCVTTRDEGEALKRDIATLKTEVAQSQRQSSEARMRLEGMENRLAELEGTLNALRRQDAEGGVQLDKVVQEVQTLRGEVEQARHELGETTATVKDILARPSLSVTEPQKGDPGKAATIDGQEVPTEGKPHYFFAKKLYDEKKYAAAAEAFDLFLQRHRADLPALVDNATFLHAESYFELAASEKNKKAKTEALKQAIRGYQRVNEDPKSKKKDEALFKIGLAFEELGNKSDAVIFYKEVVQKYPKSSVASDARKKIAAFNRASKKRR